jgi:hypothetical protein
VQGRVRLQTYGWGKGRSHVLLVGSVLHVLVDANRLAGNAVPYTELANAAVSKAVMEGLRGRRSSRGYRNGAPQTYCPSLCVSCPFS